MRSNLGSIFVAALLTLMGAGATATACSSFAGDDALADDGGAPESGDATVIAPATDAAPPAPDLDSGFVTLTFGKASCPLFTPCGGNISGTWNFSGGCFDDAIPYPKIVCLGQGGIAPSDEKVMLRGTLQADGKTIVRMVEVHYSATLSTNAQCKSANANPADDSGAGGCETIAMSLTNSAGTAICKDDTSTGGCTCSYAGIMFDPASLPYTVDASTLTTGGSSPRTFAFCVGPDQLLRFTETTPYAVDTVYSLSPQ